MHASERNNRILIIDDNQAIHADFRKILGEPTSNGTALADVESFLFEGATVKTRPCYQISSAYQGQEGFGLVQEAIQNKRPFAVAFVDVRMPPGWDGVETTEKIWSIDPDIQIVICTAYSDYSWDEVTNRLENPDRLLILKKPFDTVEVLQLANALSEKWWLLQKLKSQLGELERAVTERTHELCSANARLVLEVTDRKQAEEVLRTKTEQLQAIAGAMGSFLQTGDWRQGSTILLQSALKQTASEYGFVGAITSGNELRILAHAHSAPPNVSLSASAGDSAMPELSNWGLKDSNNPLRLAVTTGETVICNTIPVEFVKNDDLLPGYPPLRQFLGAPILNGSEVVGLIGVANCAQGYAAKDTSAMEILTGAAGLLYDNYRRQQHEASLQQQLRQAQKVEAVGRLAGGVAHDFNNILTAILGYGELMRSKIAQGDPLKSHAEEILKAAQRAASLTRQLLAFSRKQILEPKVVDLNDVVHDLIKMLRRMIDENVELTAHTAANLGKVKVDLSQMEQVITNLVINARDAMPKGGKLCIETANITLDTAYAVVHEGVTPGDYIRLTVSDTGVGMTAEVLSRLFEPFFTTKEQGKGTGLGLATCYGIVKQSGGHITVSSRLGGGTAFHVDLPQIVVTENASPEQTNTPKMPVGLETILIAEDEPALRELGAMMLRSLGYTVLQASDGVEAMQIAQTRNGAKIDLLLTDVVMPRMGGKELADHLQAGDTELKVLFCSGYTEDTIDHHGILDDGVAFLRKPYTLDALACRVRELLDMADIRSKLPQQELIPSH